MPGYTNLCVMTLGSAYMLAAASPLCRALSRGGLSLCRLVGRGSGKWEGRVSPNQSEVVICG